MVTLFYSLLHIWLELFFADTAKFSGGEFGRVLKLLDHKIFGRIDLRFVFGTTVKISLVDDFETLIKDSHLVFIGDIKHVVEWYLELDSLVIVSPVDSGDDSLTVSIIYDSRPEKVALEREHI